VSEQLTRGYYASKKVITRPTDREADTLTTHVHKKMLYYCVSVVCVDGLEFELNTKLASLIMSFAVSLTQS